jgi:hypothetical protein
MTARSSSSSRSRCNSVCSSDWPRIPNAFVRWPPSFRGGLRDALDDLRDLARGIYPPLLADKGLAAALEAQGRKAAVTTTIEPDGVGRYPREVGRLDIESAPGRGTLVRGEITPP